MCKSYTGLYLEQPLRHGNNDHFQQNGIFFLARSVDNMLREVYTDQHILLEGIEHWHICLRCIRDSIFQGRYTDWYSLEAHISPPYSLLVDPNKFSHNRCYNIFLLLYSHNLNYKWTNNDIPL